MSMATPDPARKRLLPEELPLSSQKRARNTLSKPFRSPMMARKPAETSTTTVCSTEAASHPPSTPIRPSSVLLRSTPRPSTPYTRPTAATPTPASTTSRPSRPSLPSASRSAPPDIDRLQKDYTALLIKLRTEKAKLETLKQALALEKRAKENSQLREDTETWRGCARSAAEWMFGVAKERVGRFGGHFEKKKDDWGGGGWDEEVKKGGSEDGSQEERYEDLGGESQEEEKKVEPVDEGLKEFTMTRMLKIMGIEEKMLGWDEAGGRWID